MLDKKTSKLYSCDMKLTLDSTSPSEFRKSSCGRGFSERQLWWALAFGASLIAVTLALRHLSLPPFIRLLTCLVPLGTGFMYMLNLVRDMRNQMDELRLRIYLEASVVVVCGLFIIMLTYPTLMEAGILPALDYSIVMVLMVALLTGGYLTARRRYL